MTIQKYFHSLLAVAFYFTALGSAEAAFQLQSRQCETMDSATSTWEQVETGGASGTLRFYKKTSDDVSQGCPSQLKLEPGLAVVDVMHFVSSSDSKCVYKSLGKGISVTSESWNSARYFAIRCPNPVD